MPPPTATLGVRPPSHPHPLPTNQSSQLTTSQAKIKVQLKLALTRLRMIQSRDASLTKASHRSVAQLLEARKLDSARIRVESIIRADVLAEVHEILELYCELLLARFPLLDASGVSGNGGGKKAAAEVPPCDPGLEEAVKSIIYAAPRTEIKELGTLRVLLGEKFGKEFLARAMEGVEGGVSEKVVRRLGVEPPKPELVEGYLEEIAGAYGVEWAGSAKRKETEELDLLVDMGSEEGGGNEGGQALKELEGLDGTPAPSPPPRPAAASPPAKPASASPNSRGAQQAAPPKATEMKPVAKQETKSPPPPSPPGGGVPDLTELERRFAALKKLG